MVKKREKIRSKEICLKLFIPILFLLVQSGSEPLFAQYSENDFIMEVNANRARNAIGELNYDDIEGSPYYTDQFVYGKVFLKDESQYYSLPLRYDLFQDEVEFQRYGTTFWILKEDVSSIRYGSDTLIPEFTAENQDKPVYFIVRGNGAYTLYIREKADFHPYVPAQAYADPKPNRFERAQNEYYLKIQSRLPVKLERKKDLLTVLKDNDAALKFVKKSKIRINEEDLISLVGFLNAQ